MHFLLVQDPKSQDIIRHLLTIIIEHLDTRVYTIKRTEREREYLANNLEYMVTIDIIDYYGHYHRSIILNNIL